MAAAMPLLPPLLLLALLGAFAARGQDFDLSDALDDPKKPLPTPKKPSGGGAGDDLDLSDALGGHDPQPPPRPPPPRPRDPQKPDARPAGGDFSNSDLEDAAGGRAPPTDDVTSPPLTAVPPPTGDVISPMPPPTDDVTKGRGQGRPGETESGLHRGVSTVHEHPPHCPGRGGEGPRGGEPDPEGSAPQGLVPGLVAAALAALAGGVSSFVAYQKRRLCFRDAGPAPV